MTTASDAVILQRLFTPARPASPLDESTEQLHVSAQKLIDLAEREHVALAIFGHDGEQWQGLKKVPEYYGCYKEGPAFTSSLSYPRTL